MVGKYALVFVLAFCVQGYSSVPISESRAIIDNILQDLDKLVFIIEKIILDISYFINNLTSNLRKIIKEAIQSIDVSGTVEAIEDKIEDILNAAGIDVSVAGECIDAEKVSVNNLVKQTSKELDKCRKTAELRTMLLEEKLTTLSVKALTLLNDVMREVGKCYLDNPSNIFKQTRCFAALLVEVTKKVNALVIQVAQTTIAATKTAEDISATVVKCTSSINNNINNGQLQIIENFQTCVDNITNPRIKYIF